MTKRKVKTPNNSRKNARSQSSRKQHQNKMKKIRMNSIPRET
jgi:hypothetical protein